MDTKTPSTPTIVLVPGYWLGAWAWDAVAAELRGRGYHVIAVTLPGLDRSDPHRASTTVAQQAEIEWIPSTNSLYSITEIGRASCRERV